MNGKLYVVATPIGNLDELSPRALEALKTADIIAAEDTRVTKALLHRFGIKKRMVSYFRHNEEVRAEALINNMLDGLTVALVSDAGTPGISDPGHVLVRRADESGIGITAVGGPCAVAAALSISGFDSSSFVFYGFLPRKKGDLAAALKRIRADSASVAVIYESPIRIVRTMEAIGQSMPEAGLCLCNDLTKKFERVYRGSPAEVLARLMENSDREKGEYTLVMEKPPTSPAEGQKESGVCIEALLVDIMIKEQRTLKDAISALASREDAPGRNEIYEASLGLKEFLGEHGHE